MFSGTEEDPRERELNELRGEKVADNWEDDPRLAKVAADPDTGTEASNAAGSYEAFMAMMSGGTKPAMQDINGSGDGQG